MRNPELQRKVINYGVQKATPVIQKVGKEMLNQLSTKVRPNQRYITDRPDLDGSGFPIDEFNVMWDVNSQTRGRGLWVPCSFGVPNFSPKLLKAFVKAAPNHHGYMDVLQKTLKNYYGGAVDIHKMIGKLPKPKRGWTLPGHRYTGPYNPLEKQLEYDPETGEILKIHQPPTGPSDAVAMVHEVDYSVCANRAEKYGENKKNCKHDADRKMGKSLDAIPYKERQLGHWLARNAINTKQKLGLGVRRR